MTGRDPNVRPCNGPRCGVAIGSSWVAAMDERGPLE